MNVTALQRARAILPVRILVFALAYALIAILGLALLDMPAEIVEPWPAAGLATAVLLAGDRRSWPAIPLGFLLVHGFNSAVPLAATPSELLVAPPLVGAAAATLQACLAIALINRRFGSNPARLNARRDWLELALYAGPLSCGAGALLAGLCLYLQGIVAGNALLPFVLNWWAGDMMGVLLVLPAVLIWPTWPSQVLRWQGRPLPHMSRLTTAAAAIGLILTFSLSYTLKVTGSAKNDKLFMGTVDRGEGHLLHEYVSLKSVLNATALDISHVPQDPMFGLSQLRNPESVYHLEGMSGFGLIQYRALPAAELHSPKAGLPMSGNALDVRYFEPTPRGEALRGLKLQWDKDVEAAASEAFETGRAAVAGVTLSAPGKQPVQNIILLQPAFDHNVPGTTLDTRRNSLIGWVFLLVAPEKIFGPDIDNEAEGAYLAHVETSGPSGAPDSFRTVFVSDDTGKQTPRFRKTDTVEAFERNWHFTWFSTPWFETAIMDRTPVLVLYGGLLVTALIAGLVQSMSDREKKIRQAEQRWLMAMEGSEIGVFDVDLVHQKGVTSDYWNRMIGVDTLEDAINPEAEWRSRIHPDDRPAFEQAQTDLIQGRSDRLLHEYRLQVPGGNWRWMRDSARIVERDADGRPRRLLGTMADITPLHEALDLAEEREQELSSLIENAPVAMSVLTRNGTFLIVNDAFCDYVGYPKDTLVGMNARDMPNFHEPEIYDLQLQELLAGRASSFTLERHYHRPDGGESDGIVTASVMHSGRANEPKIIVQIVDITERKRLERLKGDFVATVSHELRTPLTSISGSIALILGTMAADLPDKARHMLDIAHNNARRLGSLVNDLLDMQKIASGNITLEKVQTDLGAVMKEAVNETDAYAKRFGVRYVLNLPGEPLSAQIDINRFKQVMANLMSNAAKFSPEGGQIEITLERGKGRQRRFACVSVTDHGRGIPPEFRDRIFRPFSQAASSSTRDREGTGLGLVISKEIVEKMGGTIGFDSEPDVSTTFWFRFPIGAPVAETEPRGQDA